MIVLEHNFREPVQQTDNMPSADTTVAPAWNSLSRMLQDHCNHLCLS